MVQSMTTTARADLMFRPVSDLAGLVRRGEVSARELVETSLRRIEELDGQLDAFIDVDGERALAEAENIGTDDPRPFAGVPIAIKNNRAVKGWRLTHACDLMQDFVADFDHNVVRRFKEAGFVIVGTSNLPEYGILPSSEPRQKSTRNPWDPDRTPGGSSGGSGAAVASGMIPIGHANDGGGSTRIPAACCGLVGLKPQRNRISLAPEIGQSFLAVDGALPRTVADPARALDALAGPEVGDSAWAPPPPEPFAATAGREPGRLRAAGTGQPPLDVLVPPPAPQAARDAAALLESLGHEVEEADPPWRQPRLGELFTALFAPLVMLQVAQGRLISGREPTAEQMEPLSWALWQLVGGMSALDAHLAAAQLEIFARGLLGWMDAYDVVVAPALAEAPVLLDTVDWRTDDPMGLFTRSAAFTPFTATANVTGQPAISLPLAEHDGLPVGVQLFGRPAQEGALLAVAAQLEAARPWTGRRPQGA